MCVQVESRTSTTKTDEKKKWNACSRQHAADVFPPLVCFFFFSLCLDKVSGQAVLFDKKRFQILLSLSFFYGVWLS